MPKLTTRRDEQADVRAADSIRGARSALEAHDDGSRHMPLSKQIHLGSGIDGRCYGSIIFVKGWSAA